MEKSHILSLIAVVDNLFQFIHKEDKAFFFVEINWFENNTNITIKERITNEKMLNIDIDGNIDTYEFIIKNITKLIINNNAFGYLYTKNKNGRIVTDCHGIKTKNLEITMPIYNQEELMRAEAINNMLLNNKQTEKVNVKKIAHSK